MEYSKSTKVSFVSDGLPYVQRLGYLPTNVSMWNLTAWDSDDNPGIVKRAWGFSNKNGEAFAVKNTDGAATDESVHIADGGFLFITRDTQIFGPAVTGTGVSQAAQAVVSMTAHGFNTGDVVLLTNTTGMNQIAGEFYTVTVINDNSFSIPVDSFGFSSAATNVVARRVLYPDLYVPFRCAITEITQAAQAVVTTSMDHRFVVGQRIKLQVPQQWGMVEADGLDAFVLSVTANTVTLDLNTSAFTAFSYPTSVVAALGMDFPAIYPIGDRNFGFLGPFPPFPAGIPGAFFANTGNILIVGIGDGTNVIHADGDEVELFLEYPDQIVS